MDRETKTIDTTFGHKVVLKSYLTAKEGNALKTFVGKNLNVNTNTEGEVKQNFTATGSYLMDYEKEEINLVVISVDSATENVFEKLEELRLEEYAQVLKAVQEITKDVFPQAKNA